MLTPNKDRLRLWVKWLLDPTHQQTTGSLRVDREEGPTYCCLGGACEVFKAETGKGEWVGNDSLPRQFCVGTNPDCDVSDATLPRPVWEWFGLNHSDPQLTEDGDLDGYGCATSLNDNRHWTFTQIANAVVEMFELNKE